MKKGSLVMQMVVTMIAVIVYAAATYAVLRLAGLPALAFGLGCLNGLALVMALGIGFVVGRGLVQAQVERSPAPGRSGVRSKAQAKQDSGQVVYMLLEDNDEADAGLFDGWLR